MLVYPHAVPFFEAKCDDVDYFTHTHTHTHTHIYIYIYISVYMYTCINIAELVSKVYIHIMSIVYVFVTSYFNPLTTLKIEFFR